MTTRSFLHHAAGIAFVGFTIAPLFVASVLHERGLAFLLVIITFVPGYFGLRYLRGLSGWRTR